MKERDHMLTSAEAGRRLGVSDRTIKRWVEAGKLRGYRPGKAYQVPESAVEALLAESEVHPKERAPRSVAEQLRENPSEPVNLLEAWESEDENTGFPNKWEPSLIGTLLGLDKKILSAGEDPADRLEVIDGLANEEDSPTLLKWLETRRDWVERGIYKPMHPMTKQAAARSIERLLTVDA